MSALAPGGFRVDALALSIELSAASWIVRVPMTGGRMLCDTSEWNACQASQLTAVVRRERARANRGSSRGPSNW